MRPSFLRLSSLFCLGLALSVLGACTNPLDPPAGPPDGPPDAPPAATFAVRYHANGGAGEAPVDGTRRREGELVRILGPGTLGLAGHAFRAWATVDASGGASFAPGSDTRMPAADLELYADWAPLYSTSYDANGAESGSPPDPHPAAVAGTERIVAGNSGGLALAGFIFAGWNDSPDGSGLTYREGDSLAQAPAEAVLYARWATQTFRAIYEPGAPEVVGEPPLDANEYQADDVVDLAEPGGLALDGHVFEGWSAEESGGLVRLPGETLPMPEGGLRLYARWLPASTLSYATGAATGGSPPPPSLQAEGRPVEVAQNGGGLVRTGHFFVGWNDRPDGTGVDYAPGSTLPMPVADLVLYPKWTPALAVTYNANGGSGAVPVDPLRYRYAIDSFRVLPPTGLARPGFYFSEWSDTRSGPGTSYAVGSDYQMDGYGKVLYARWLGYAYLTYSSSGAEGGQPPADPVGYRPGEIAVVKGNEGGLSKEGHSFGGWRDALVGGNLLLPGASYSMPQGGRTLYPVFGQGTAAWARSSQPGSGNSMWKAVARADDGSIFAAGEFRGSGASLGAGVSADSQGSSTTAILAKYAPDGTPLWARAISSPPGSGSEFNAVTLGPDGAVYAAGSTYGAGGDTRFSAGAIELTVQGFGKRAIVVKYSAQGDDQWMRADASTAPSEFLAIAPAPGGIWAAGNASGAAAHRFGELTRSAPGTSATNALVARYDSAGNVDFARIAGPDGDGDRSSAFQGAAEDSEGGVYLVGWQQGGASFTWGPDQVAGDNPGRNFLAVRLREDGGFAWARVAVPSGAMGTLGNSEFAAAAAAPGGGVYVAGTIGQGNYRLPPSLLLNGYVGQGSYAVVRYAPDGSSMAKSEAQLSAGQLRVPDAGFTGIAVDGEGRVHAVGFTSNYPASFLAGSLTVSAPAYQSLAFVTFDAALNPLWFQTQRNAPSATSDTWTTYRAVAGTDSGAIAAGSIGAGSYELRRHAFDIEESLYVQGASASGSTPFNLVIAEYLR